MKMVNASGSLVRVPRGAVASGGTLAGAYVLVEGGQEVEIHDGYAKPRRAANGDRSPSVIEQLAPQLRPADAADLAAWQSAPDAQPAASAAKPPTVASLVAAGVPQGVAEAIVAAKAAPAPAADDEKPKKAKKGE